MPNNEEYDAEYRLDGDVTFSAKNAQVESSDNVSKSQHGNRYFVPAFILQQKSRQKYALNVINVLHSETGSYEPGSTFVANLRNISPFEAYMTDNAAGARMDIPIELNEATSIDGLEIAEGADGIQRVFNMAGQLLIRTDNVPELKRQIELLPAGVYIVNGKKKQIK